MNPVREVRKRTGQTLEQFSRACRVHPQALYLTECGAYPHVLPSIKRYIRFLGYDGDKLDEEYTEYQQMKRRLIGSKIKAKDITLGPPDFNEHPFIEFRTELGFSRMGFAKTFCIHPAFLYKLEKGEALGLSHQLKEALTQAGFPVVLIAELDYRSMEFAEQRQDLGTVRAAI